MNEAPASGPASSTEARLEALAISFRQMAENVPGALFRYVLRPDGSDAVEYMSPRCLELWEVPPEAIERDATLLWQMIDAEDLPGMQQSVMASARSLEPWQWEWRITTPSGRRKWLEGRGRPTRYDDGRIVWNSLILDVTERRRVDEALRDSEHRLALVMEATGEGVWDWDVREGVVRHNRRWCEMLGVGDALLEHPLEAFSGRVHPEDRERVLAAVDAAIANTAPYRIEYRLLRADGRPLWVQDRGAVVARDAHGAALRMVGSIADVDERRRAEQALRRLNDELEQRIAERTADLARAKAEAERANQAKSDFLASMSHELRTPMNAVLGFAQLLALEPVLDAKGQDWVREILRAGHHLLELINELLDLARVESGRLRLSLEPVALGALVDETLALVAPIAAARHVALEVEPALRGHVVHADRTRLRQVLMNLLSNAIKYNVEGGRVRLQAPPAAAGRLRVAVSDTGRGIAPERLPELFQPFHRLAPDGHEPGTGIGLVITRRLVEAMDGEVGVASRPGQGTTFWVELPQAEAGRPAAVPPAPPGHAVPDGAAAVRPLRVLYIDDNPANVKLVGEVLAQRPNVVLLSAPAGGLGVELALAHRPDLVLLDLQLPDIDGYEVLARLRAAPGLAAVPVAALTSQGSERDLERGRAAGFADYLVKPLSVPRLLALVDALAAPPG